MHQKQNKDEDTFSLSLSGGYGPIQHHCKGAASPVGLGGTCTHLPTVCPKSCQDWHVYLQYLQSKDLPHFFSEEKLLQWKWCETGGWFTALFRRRCFHSQLSKQYIISCLRWGYVILSHEASSFALLHVLPAKLQPVNWEQNVIKIEGQSIASIFFFKSICLSELTIYIMCCDLSADMSSSCLQKPVSFLQKIISTRPLSIWLKEERSCCLFLYSLGCLSTHWRADRPCAPIHTTWWHTLCWEIQHHGSPWMAEISSRERHCHLSCKGKTSKCIKFAFE